MFLVRTHPVARGIKIGSNQPPQWQSVPTPSFVLGVASNFPPSGTYQSNGYVTDADGGTPAITWVSGSVSGVTWDGGKFVYDGLGSAGTTGSLVLRASDGTDTVDSATFSIVIESNLAWSATPSVSFVEASVTPTNLGAYVTNYNASTDEFRITPSYSLPTWLSLTTGPGTGSGNLTPNGNQVDANDVSASPGIKIDVRRSGGAWVSSAAFGVTVTAIQAATFGSIDDLAFEGIAWSPSVTFWTDPQGSGTSNPVPGKHVNNQYCPDNGKFYLHGGDGGYPGMNSSGAIHSFRYSVNAQKTALTFDLYYPYWGVPGEEMPCGPGCNPWYWDDGRGCFWVPGGFHEGANDFVNNMGHFVGVARNSAANPVSIGIDCVWRFWVRNTTGKAGKWERMPLGWGAMLVNEGQQGIYHPPTDCCVALRQSDMRLVWFNCATGASGNTPSGRSTAFSNIDYEKSIWDPVTNELIYQDVERDGGIYAVALNGWSPSTTNTARTTRNLWTGYESGGNAAGRAQRNLFIRGTYPNRKLYTTAVPWRASGTDRTILTIDNTFPAVVHYGGGDDPRNGDIVTFVNIPGMPQINGMTAPIFNTNPVGPFDTFEVNIDARAFGVCTGGGNISFKAGNGLGIYELSIDDPALTMRQGSQPAFELFAATMTEDVKISSIASGAYHPVDDVWMTTDTVRGGTNGAVPLLFKWSAPTWTPAAGNAKPITIDSHNTATNTMMSVAQSNIAQYGTVGPYAVINAWASMCYARLLSTNGCLLFCNGGDGDYWGNEIYCFDLDTRRWSRLTDRTTALSGVPATDAARAPSHAQYFNSAECEHGPDPTVTAGWSENTTGLLPVGTQPGVPHTYDSLEWIPSDYVGNRRGALIQPVKTFVYPTASTTRAHYFDLDPWEKRWGRFSSNKFGVTPALPFTALDLAQDRIYHNYGYLRLDNRQQVPVNWNWGIPVYDTSSVLDPVRRLWIAMSTEDVTGIPGALHAIAVDSTTGAQTLTLSGTRWDKFDARYAGIEYCPPLDCFFFYNAGRIGSPNQEPQVVYKIVPPAGATTAAQGLAGTWTVTKITMGIEGAAVVGSERGTYGKFRWVQPLKCFAFVNNADGAVYLYKPEGV